MDELKIIKEIEYYNCLPFVFDDFFDLPKLTDGEISLKCTLKNPACDEKGWTPFYNFNIILNGEIVGDANVRIGYTEGLYYCGHIGYNVDAAYRGRGIAVAACHLLAVVAKMHKMTKLLICNDEKNIASRRVCEKLGAKYIRTADMPKWHNLYKEQGLNSINIYEWGIT